MNKIYIFTMYLYFLSFVPISFLLQNFVHRFKMMRGNGQKTFGHVLCFIEKIFLVNKTGTRVSKLNNYEKTKLISHLFFLSLKFLLPSDIFNLGRSHALPAVWNDPVGSKSTLSHSRVLCQDVPKHMIGNLCHVIIQLLLFL